MQTIPVHRIQKKYHLPFENLLLPFHQAQFQTLLNYDAALFRYRRTTIPTISARQHPTCPNMQHPTLQPQITVQIILPRLPLIIPQQATTTHRSMATIILRTRADGQSKNKNLKIFFVQGLAQFLRKFFCVLKPFTKKALDFYYP